MRSRTRSIRFKIFALFFIPLFALFGLWGFAASITAGDAIDQRDFDILNKNLGTPSQQLMRELGQERLQSVMFLSGGDSASRAGLDAQRTRTDPMASLFRRQVLAPESQHAYSAATKQYAEQAIRQLDLLAGVRSTVNSGGIDRVKTLQAYNGIIDSLFHLFGAFSSTRDDIAVYRATQGIILGHRGLDMIGRESALIAAAAGTDGRLTKAEHELFSQQVHVRRFLMGEARSQMAAADFRTAYDQVFASPAYRNLGVLEDEVIAETSGRRLPVAPESWQPAAQSLANSFDGAALTARDSLGERSLTLSGQALFRLGLVGGLGLVMVVASVLLSIRFGRRVTRELVGLQEAAQELAEVRLPEVVDRLRLSQDVDVTTEVPPLRVGKITEVANVAESFSKVQRTAIEAAVGQAELRKGVSQIFLNLARRNQSLLHRQLTMLDALESRAEPDVLEDLFRLDHLTTRMRRHAEGLIILSGAAPGRGWREPVRIVDVLRGAAGEVEDYTRVAVLTASRDAVVGSAVADVIHLLAELMENATSFSPPTTEVHVMAEMVGNGLAVEIEDRGLGMSPAAMEEINRQLASPPEFDLADTDQLGLFVVGRLAERHAVNVSLRRSPYGGTTAIVLLPHGIVVSQYELGSPTESTQSTDALPAGPEIPAEVPMLRNAAQVRQGRAPADARAGLSGRHRARPAEPSPWPQSIGAPEHGAPEHGAPEHGAPEHGAPEHGAPAAHAEATRQTRSPGHAEEQPGGSTGPRERPSSGGAAGSAGTHAGLPRRIRQESLVPQLRGEPAPQVADTGAENDRSPEEAGALIASIQEGWRRGRAAANTTIEPVDGEGS